MTFFLHRELNDEERQDAAAAAKSGVSSINESTVYKW